MTNWICPGECYLNDDGNLVTIRQDYDCESPREWECNFGTFITWQSRYNSPDKYDGDFEHFRREVGLEDEHDELMEPYWESYYDYQMECYRIADIRHQNELHKNLVKKLVYWRGALYQPKVSYPPVPDMPKPPTYPIKNELTWVIDKMNERGMYAMPVSVYEHSGLVYRVGDYGQFIDGQWDAGYAGLIFTTDERIQEFGNKNYTREQVYGWLSDEVEYYSEWSEGNCYGFITYDQYGDEVDSCWGFIGTDPNENGLAEACGGLHDCEFGNVDEFVEYHESMRLAQEVDEIAENILEGMTADNERYIA